jgi:hypothetical protein
MNLQKRCVEDGGDERWVPTAAMIRKRRKR